MKNIKWVDHTRNLGQKEWDWENAADIVKLTLKNINDDVEEYENITITGTITIYEKENEKGAMIVIAEPQIEYIWNSTYSHGLVEMFQYGELKTQYDVVKFEIMELGQNG